MSHKLDLTNFSPYLERVHELLLSTRNTVSTAESCTGGMLSMLLTALPDSSRYFLGGVAAYSNAAKISILKVDAKLIETHGAVSKEVGEAMAKAARMITGASIGIGITGIAGPGGATEGKPIGTVWLGIASDKMVNCRNLELIGTRDEIRWASSYEALKELGTILGSI